MSLALEGLFFGDMVRWSYTCIPPSFLRIYPISCGSYSPQKYICKYKKIYQRNILINSLSHFLVTVCSSNTEFDSFIILTNERKRLTNVSLAIASLSNAKFDVLASLVSPYSMFLTLWNIFWSEYTIFCNVHYDSKCTKRVKITKRVSKCTPKNIYGIGPMPNIIVLRTFRCSTLWKAPCLTHEH